MASIRPGSSRFEAASHRIVKRVEIGVGGGRRRVAPRDVTQGDRGQDQPKEASMRAAMATGRGAGCTCPRQAAEQRDPESRHPPATAEKSTTSRQRRPSDRSAARRSSPGAGDDVSSPRTRSPRPGETLRRFSTAAWSTRPEGLSHARGAQPFCSGCICARRGALGASRTVALSASTEDSDIPRIASPPGGSLRSAEEVVDAGCHLLRYAYQGG